jgi:hypothetical protein
MVAEKEEKKRDEKEKGKGENQVEKIKERNEGIFQ